MPGKFFDQFLVPKRVHSKIISHTQNKETTPPIKLLMHPGIFGKIHTDMKGHGTWNRKGRW
jgi:hypothetical protein